MTDKQLQTETVYPFSYEQAQKAVKRHYKLDRLATKEEVDAEIRNLYRRGPLNWHDRDFALAAAMGLRVTF